LGTGTNWYLGGKAGSAGECRRVQESAGKSGECREIRRVQENQENLKSRLRSKDAYMYNVFDFPALPILPALPAPPCSPYSSSTP